MIPVDDQTSPTITDNDEAPLGVAGGGNSSAEYWTPQRVRILSWLKAEAPAVAPLYEGAVRLPMDGDFPGRVWFVAHALRDMRNRLPDVIAGPLAESRTEYCGLAAEVTQRWIQQDLPIRKASRRVSPKVAPRVIAYMSDLPNVDRVIRETSRHLRRAGYLQSGE